MRQQPDIRKLGVEIFLQPWPSFPAAALLLLAGSFLHVWLWIEPSFEYHSTGPYFFRQWSFFENFLGRPGGLAHYAGIFLSQFHCQNWLGALVFVLSQFLILLAALACLAPLAGRAPGWAALAPPFVLLLLRNRYACPVPVLSAGLFLSLAASAAYFLLPWRRPGWRVVAGGVISALLFFVAGLWSALLFAVMCGLYAILQKRNWLVGLAGLALAFGAPLGTIGMGNLEMATLVNPWPEGVDYYLAATLYASVPVIGTVLAFWPKTASIPKISQPERWMLTSPFGRAVVVLLLGGAAVWLTFDPRQKFLAKIDCHAVNRQYDAVLAAADRLNMLDDPAMIRAHWALYHAGRMAEDLFSFHNMIEVAPSPKMAEGYRAQSQTLLDLGLVNDAEHLAYEALELEGERPDLLRLLARINLLKDQPQAAQIFLNRLSLIPFSGEPPNPAWPSLNPPIPAAERAYLDQVRSRALTNDVMHDGLPLGRMLDALLEANPTNQMAFEYALAHYLMDLDLTNAVERLGLLDNFRYTHIPRSYEEALLLYQQRAGAPIDLKGRSIRPATAERFRQFKETVRQLQGRADAQAVMAAHFGDTYWYYFVVRSRERAAQASAP